MTSSPENVEIQQVAQFVANPIEIVEYHRVHNQCTRCGTVCAANWSDEIIPGQDARGAFTSIDRLVGQLRPCAILKNSGFDSRARTN